MTTHCPRPPQDWMTVALMLAKAAAKQNEVPIGALIIKDNRIIATGFNRKESLKDPTQHAEMIAIRKASNVLGNWRLKGCELYVTLEPCLMCAGAIYQARIEKLFFGAFDRKAGAIGSIYQINEDSRLNHNFDVTPGILEKECADLLRKFFKQRRQNGFSLNLV